jgi:hypothetical protein
MRTTEAILIVAAASSVGVLVAFPLRSRFPRPMIDTLMAVVGAAIGVGGLMMLDDVGKASWIAAPAVLALIAPLHVRALFARGGPFRT